MISDFTERIEIRRIVLSDGFGFDESTTSETSILTTWASIKEVSRASAVKQALEVETLNYKMSIRYNTGREIRQDDVIIWNGARYKPKTSPSVIEIDKKKFLQLIIARENG